MLTSNFILLTWLIDLKVSQVHANLAPCKFGQHVATSGFLLWWWRVLDASLQCKRGSTWGTVNQLWALNTNTIILPIIVGIGFRNWPNWLDRMTATIGCHINHISRIVWKISYPVFCNLSRDESWFFQMWSTQSYEFDIPHWFGLFTKFGHTTSLHFDMGCGAQVYLLSRIFGALLLRCNISW